MTAHATRLRALYHQLPEEVRRGLRPLNLVDEAASFLPPPVASPVRSGTERTRRLLHVGRARYRVRRLDGHAAGGAPLSCVLATDDLSARWWRDVLFAEPPREQLLGTVRALEVPRAARLAPDVELALWQVSWPVSRLVRGHVLVPSWVPLSLACDRSLEDIVRGERSGRAARKNDVRRIERLELTPRVAHDAAAWERFRRDLYEPYVRARFGDLGIVLAPHAFRHARRRGWLLLLEQREAPTSGAVLVPHGEELRVLAFGATGDAAAARTGVEACYYHAIRLAVERGFRRLALGTARPVLTDGVLRYKRKWGARLGAPDTLDRFLLLHRNTPALREVLTATPLVVERSEGGLAGLVGARGVDAEAQLARIDVPGLRELVLLAEPDVDRARPLTAPYSQLAIVPPSGR